jgi:hypothetical protein
VEKEDRLRGIARSLNEADSPKEAHARKLRETNLLNQDLVIDQFISEALPQAEALYNVYLEGGPRKGVYRYKEDRKATVISHYNHNRAQFPLVLLEMLEDLDPSKLVRDQEARDFKVYLVGRMLKHWLDYHHLREELRKRIQKHS